MHTGSHARVTHLNSQCCCVIVYNALTSYHRLDKLHNMLERSLACVH